METAPSSSHPAFMRLVAIDAPRNIARAYEIEWGVDLLGDWVVETRWGRIGRRAQQKTEIFQDEAEAARRVGEHLKRRASSTKRIGIAYRQIVPPEPVPAPSIIWTTQLRHYLWIDGLDGWIEDSDDIILEVHPQRAQMRRYDLLRYARSIPTTWAWGIYADGRHVRGRFLFTGEDAAQAYIARLKADPDQEAHVADAVSTICA